jgi:hypothetical protein
MNPLRYHAFIAAKVFAAQRLPAAPAVAKGARK